MAAADVPKWKSVTPSRKDPLSLERAIKVLDRQSQLENDSLIEELTTIEGDITTIETNITNITNGTTVVYAKWSAYTGPMILWWIMFNG